MAKLTNKYDVIRMGDTPDFMSGVYDVLEKYLDPDYQMRRRAEKEEQERYDTRQQQLIAQQNYNSDISRYNQANEDFRLALSSANTPEQQKMILDNYADANKTFTIRNLDGSIDNRTLNTETFRAINDDNISIKNEYNNLEEQYRNASPEEKVNLYPQLEVASRRADISITPSMTNDFTSAKSFVDNSKIVDFMTTPEFLKGTGVSSEDVEFVKSGLLSGDVSDAKLKTYVDYIERKTASKKATTDFFQKLYNKTLDNVAKLKMDSDPEAIKTIQRTLEIAKKGLGMSDEQKLVEQIYEDAGGKEAYEALSQEQQDKILSKYLTAGFTGDTENTGDTGDTEEIGNTEDKKDKEGYFSKLFSQPAIKGLGEEAKQSRKVAISRISERDPLQVRGRKNRITNPFSPTDKSKLKDPVSGKNMDRNTLLSKMKNNPKAYASLGYVYDPSAKVKYTNQAGKESSFMIGYRKVSPKEALQNMSSFSEFSPRPIQSFE